RAAGRAPSAVGDSIGLVIAATSLCASMTAARDCSSAISNGRGSTTKSRSPACTSWLSTTLRGAGGPPTWGAIPTTFARTAASSVRGSRYAMRVTARPATSAAIRMAKPRIRPRPRRPPPPEQEQPGDTGHEQRERRIDQQDGHESLLEPGRREHHWPEARDHDAGEEAQHPGREERPVDVDDRITPARQHECRAR